MNSGTGAVFAMHLTGITNPEAIMNTILKNTTVALLTTISLAACGLFEKTTDSDSATGDSMDSGMDSSPDDPTGWADNVMHFNCYNDSNYQVNPAGGKVYFPLMNTCVELLDSNWESEENMTIILDGCTAMCQKSYGGWQNHCVNEGWKSVEPTETDCNPENYGPEYGGDVLWLDGVRSLDRQVKCDLRTTCGDVFVPSIAEMLRGGNVLPDERPPSGAQQQSDLQFRVEYGTGGPLDLVGTLEYSINVCGETACPFYLGDLELLQMSDVWRMAFALDGLGSINKNISNLRVRLAKPTLGISLTDGQVAFPAEALTFRVDVEVAGAEHSLIGNGTQSYLVRNPTAVVGRLIDGSLVLEMEVPTLAGPVRFSTRRDG